MIKINNFNLFRTDISSDITAHDLLKGFALILMVIDHLGAFFYTTTEELRLIGRLSAPIWFFLIGYAMTKKLELRIWVWAFILLGGFFYMRNGYGLLPLNILFSFLLIRATLDYMMERAVQDFEKLFGIFCLFVLLAMPLHFVIEYGAFGFMFAAAGYLVRHKTELKNISFPQICLFMFLSVTAYTFMMWYDFKFDLINTVFLYVLLICMCFSLLSFEAKTFPAQTGIMKVVKYPLFLMGRRTLEFYVLHLLLFMYITVYGIDTNSLFP